jgi:hypothetical protein
MLVSAATAPRAHEVTAPIDRTLAIQLQRIQEGRRTGALTRREYEARVAEQARIADMERRAQENGVSGREFEALREAQRDAAYGLEDDLNNNRVNTWRRWKTRHDM